MATNPNAMLTMQKNSIFTNVAETSDGELSQEFETKAFFSPTLMVNILFDSYDTELSPNRHLTSYLRQCVGNYMKCCYMIDKPNGILWNLLLGGVFWEGLEKETPMSELGFTDWLGNSWQPGNGKPAAHPNSR